MVAGAGRRHFGDWISVRVNAEKSPPRFTLTIAFGELPEGWGRARVRASSWAAILGLICLAPFAALLAANLLRGVGVGEPYAWMSTSVIAIVAATISLFVGIPVAIAVNLWRITRFGFKRQVRALEGLVALQFAPLHLVVVSAALLIAVLFIGHLAADTLACVNGVKSAC